MKRGQPGSAAAGTLALTERTGKKIDPGPSLRARVADRGPTEVLAAEVLAATDRGRRASSRSGCWDASS